MAAKSEAGLNDRTREILRLIIRSYVNSGEPVGSRTLAKSMDWRLSPATIRNIMADLEDDGYLEQPHTSAGRIPSERGYRFYVDHLAESGKVSKSDERYINRLLAESDTPEELMGRASLILSTISKNVGLVIAPPLAATVLKHIEFVDLSDGKVLVVFVSKTGLLQRKLIRVGERYSQEELDKAGRYLVEKFSGKTLTEIRNDLIRLMQFERSLFDRMLALLRTWSDTLSEESSPDSVYLQGTVNILNQPEFADVERMRTLFQMFEEKSRLVKILNECISNSRTTGAFGNTPSLDAECRAGLRPRRNRELLFPAFKCRNHDLRAERSLRHIDGHVAIKVVLPALEKLVVLDVQDDIEIARLTAFSSGISFTRNP